MIDIPEIKDFEDGNSIKLVDSWQETLKKSELVEILTELSEFGLDGILQEGMVKDIPLLSTVVSIYKLGHTLRERSYIKKLIIFLKELEEGNVDEKKRQKYIDRITKNRQIIQKELEYVMTLLDRFLSEQKAKYLGRLFLAYIYEEIDWSMFCQLSELIDRLLPNDIKCMASRVLGNPHRNEIENCMLQHLQGLGIVTANMKASVFDVNGNPLSAKFDGTYNLTALGKKLSGFIF